MIALNSSARQCRLPMLARSLALTFLTACVFWTQATYGSPKHTKAPDRPQTIQLFDGKLLGKWRVADTFFFENHGAVKVADGQIQLSQGKPATGITWSGEMPSDNYELALEAKRTGGDDFFCGVTFPVGDSHATLIIGGWGGTLVGLSNVNAESAAENETADHMEFESGRWYCIRLRVSHQRIQAWIDKDRFVDLPRKDRKFTIWWEQEPMRPLGIANWRTSSAVRRISLKRIGESRKQPETVPTKNSDQ